LLVITGLGSWVAQQSFANYEKMEEANQITNELLVQQTAAVRDYSQRVALLKDNLAQTESFLGKIQEENEQLRKQVQLMGELSKLENTIADLQTENTQIVYEMENLKHKVKEDRLEIESVRQGRDLVNKYARKISQVKSKMRALEQKAFQERIAFRQEQDKEMLLLGNNGYLVRNGSLMPVTIPSASPVKDITVNVKFVK
jgi:chromosome segregation ATPase